MVLFCRLFFQYDYCFSDLGVVVGQVRVYLYLCACERHRVSNIVNVIGNWHTNITLIVDIL